MTDRGGSTHGDPAVLLLGITKAFPGVVANDDITLALLRGEVHCLLGENGAGKSTLMNVLSGMLRPDAGSIVVGGREVEIDSPRRALELGIGMVYQHTTLIQTLTVLENLMLGTGSGLRLDVTGARARLAELAGMLGVEIDPDAVTGTLALGEQQQVEIVKALWRGSSVLILDEPTSMLTPQGVAELAKVLEGLTQHGLAVVFITHKLHEAAELGDRVSILKQGRLVGELGPDDLRSRTHEQLQAEIVRLMFGEEAREVAHVVELEEHVEGHRPRLGAGQEPLLELIHVSAAGDRSGVGLEDVSLAVLPGEIMGVAGVDGNGQRELAEVIGGQRPPTAGEIRFDGRTISTLAVSKRERLGLRYVTDDRLGEGTVGSMSVALNLVLKRIGQAPFWRRGVIQPAPIAAMARELVERFDVRTPGVDTRVATLSGGNVQKVLLARELAFEPRAVVYSKPTYGLDVRTIRVVRDRIREQAEHGVSAIVISTDLEELVDLCDRIAVLSRGRLAGVVENGPGAAQRVGELMVGRAA
ncbi:MAG: ABC transporter ATP-binding protein [Thermoleophilia bacterium]|nr:ABC transporter ATP-binding protein [Thermoleophilia bacterium]